ncbi:MAG TPA: hypothetical protein GXZ90_02065 [Clostridiales bacterium]|nr:hypothetical protein [Clostridiales bacterium]
MRIFNRIKEDKGASNTISFMVMTWFIMIMLISFVDVGLYFNTKNQLRSAAENGARSVALYGGVDTVVRDVRGDSGYTPEQLVWDSIPNSFQHPDLKTVIINNVECFPKEGRITAGDEVWCNITYIYNGLAGKFGMFNLGKGSDPSARAIVIKGSSVSEVTIEH